jgi:hypothetical protein
MSRFRHTASEARFSRQLGRQNIARASEFRVQPWIDVNPSNGTRIADLSFIR